MQTSSWKSCMRSSRASFGQCVQVGSCSTRLKCLKHQQPKINVLSTRQSFRQLTPSLRLARLQGSHCSRIDSNSMSTSVEVAPETAFSALIRREVLLFLVQMDFDRQLQRALNYENAEAADSIRSRRDVLNQAVQQFQESKGSGDGAQDARQIEVADYATEGLRLRSELQRAVDDERYQDASRIQAQLKDLQAISEAAAAAAAEVRASCANRTFRLGQRVRHNIHGYRAVVCGWDIRCCEGEAWQADNGIPDLKSSNDQPFYHLLVDLRDWKDSPPDTAIVYVPEEQLTAPQESSDVDEAVDNTDKQLQHPFGSVLFLGVDNVGDMLPTRCLRQKYSAQRRDVGPTISGDDDDEELPGNADSSDGPDSNGPSGRDFGGMRIM